MNRRTMIGASLALSGLAIGAAGCSGAKPKMATADVARRPAEASVNDAVRQSVSAVSGTLLAAAERDANVVMSPLSVMIVLAMVRNGATGQTATEMDTTLQLPDLESLNSGMNTTLQTLAARNGKREGKDKRKGDVILDLAQMAWGQEGTGFKQPFLEALAAWYGTGVAETDFSDSGAAADKINEWVADSTHDKITQLVDENALPAETLLVLANALYLKAPWYEAFGKPAKGEFTTPAGPVTTDLMSKENGNAYGEGDGWTAAQVPYLGGELAMTLVLPAEGGEADLLDSLGSGGLAEILASTEAAKVTVTMPTFSARSSFELPKVLSDLGMPRLFTEAAELTEMTDRTLMVSNLLHQGWISVDEEGTEAAAATAAVMMPTSANIDRKELVLDRPFAWIVHDVDAQLPLLVGWVGDPTQTAD